MTDIAISVQNLGKCYKIQHRGQRGVKNYRTLRESLGSAIAAPLRRFIPGLGRKSSTLSDSRDASISSPSSTESFWALKDVSFEIKQGEVVGIIGRNGAGKSTLLKLLSRITEPSLGRIELSGRVVSLLEVGTGFHPELTGRENIFLNGAIMGMCRGEIRAKFDQIVAFAEVEKFLDTPVKRYSSGMYVRLAFAVAAHLDPEILVIDEVLAVGDAQFQKKCLGKMQDVASHEGRTVLFVSHSMPTISSLCQRAFLLSAGQLIKAGKTQEVIAAYYGQTETSASVFDAGVLGRVVGDEVCHLLRAEALDERGIQTVEVEIDRPLRIRIHYQILARRGLVLVPNLHFFRADGTYAFVVHAPGKPESEPGIYEADCLIPGNLLNEGTYFIEVVISSYEPTVTVHACERSAIMFNVRDPIEGITTRAGFAGVIPGAVRPSLEWRFRRKP